MAVTAEAIHVQKMMVNTSNFRLTFVHRMLLRSDNWVPIRLINLSTSVEHQLVPMQPDAQDIFARPVYLRPLGSMPLNSTIQVDFDDHSMAYRACQGMFRQMLMLKLQTTLTYADFLLGRIQSTNAIAYQYVLCHRGEWKPNESVIGRRTAESL